MKMTKIAVAALGLCAGAAFAQDFKVYANLDGGLSTTSNQTTANSSPMKFTSGGDAPSVFGAMGSKKLANGMTASGQLEGAVGINNGLTSQSGGTTGTYGLFTRLANFSLAGNFGKVSLGLQFDPAFLAFAATDPRGISNNNSGLNAWINTGAFTQTGSQSNNAANVFSSNSIQYSNQFGGLSATLAYGPGNSTTSSGYNNTTALGLVYGAGPLTISGGTTSTTTNAANQADSSATSIGAAYMLGQWRLAATYLNGKNSSGTAEYNTTGVGATYGLSAATSLNVAYYTTKDKPNGGSLNLTTIGVSHALDKSVTLYAQLGMTKMDATGFGAAGASTANWSTDYATGNGSMAVADKTVQTLYAGARVSF
jgi:predicted porin